MSHLNGIMATPADFTKTTEKVEKLLRAAKKMAKGADAEDAGFEREYLTSYAAVARRYRDDRDLGLSRYPYEAAPGVSPYTGGFFSHPEWSVRKGLEKHAGLRAIAEYEAHYTNASGYWMAFAETALCLRGEELDKTANSGARAAERFDVWAGMGLRYGLRAVGLRTEFYRLSAKDPQHARLVMPALENQAEVPASDDIDETLGKLETHMNTQLMKAAAALTATKNVKRSGAGGAGQ